MRSKIAHISPVMPALAGNGLAMRTSMFSHAAEQTGEVLIIAVEPDGDDTMENHAFRPDTRVIRVHEGFDTRLRLIARSLPASARPGLLVGYGKPLASVALSAAAIDRIIKHLVAFEPDAIILSRVHMLPVVDAFEGALAQVPLLVDLDDDDGALCRSLATCERDAGHDDEALWLEAQADVCDATISSHIDKVDHFTAASKSVIGSIHTRLGIPKIGCVTNGVSPVATAPVIPPDIPGQTISATHLCLALIFVGNLSYRPNIDGLRWFLTEVWPSLRDAVSGVSFMVAGSNPDQQLSRLCQQDGVELIVSPHDLRPLYELADAAVVPLRFGSGSRIKILEAGSYGVPVISTFAGAEGLEIQPEQHAFLSNETASGFVQACVECLANRTDALSRSDAMQVFIRENHDRRDIVADLHRTLQKIIAG